MKQYLDLLNDVMTNGVAKTDRTGTGTLSVFGGQMRFDLQKGFPLVTTRRIFTKSLIHELIWFLKGSIDTSYLVENNVHLWDDWASEAGYVGPIYGYQWRKWSYYYKYDQINHVIESIKNNPDSRRHIVSAWNVPSLEDMALPPCHVMFQFYVHDKKLSCQMYQRSMDLPIGAPYNIASYALLTHMIAQVCNLNVGELVITTGDTHIYTNQIEAVHVMMQREPLPLSELWLNKDIIDIDNFTYSDIRIMNYEHHPYIKIPVAV